MPLLIVSSLLFYAYGEPIYVVLMLVSSVFAWGAGVILGGMQGSCRAPGGAGASPCW